MHNLPNGLKALSEFKQFIVFKVVKGKRCPVEHRTGKRPIDPFKSTNWIDASTAIGSANRLGSKHGVGFVLTDNDPFFCIIIKEHHGDIRVVGSYRGKAPPHACKNIEHNMELHTEKYVYALTGNPNRMGSAETDGTASLPDYIKTYFPPIDTVNNQYFQTITVRGEAKKYLLKHLSQFHPPTILPSSEEDILYLAGAGNHFPLYLQDNIVCRCSDLCSDVFKALESSSKGNKPFPKECDLTPIVEFLRLGGTGYGYPDYNA